MPSRNKLIVIFQNTEDIYMSRRKKDRKALPTKKEFLVLTAAFFTLLTNKFAGQFLQVVAAVWRETIEQSLEERVQEIQKEALRTMKKGVAFTVPSGWETVAKKEYGAITNEQNRLAQGMLRFCFILWGPDRFGTEVEKIMLGDASE